MTHVGKIVLLKYDSFKRITHIWNRKTIHNNKNDIDNILNSELSNIYFIGRKERKITKKSYKIYIDYKEEYKKIGYVFWDCFMNRLYYNKYYQTKNDILKSNINSCNNVEIKEIYINPDETDLGYTIG
jgi:hypothetical protein